MTNYVFFQENRSITEGEEKQEQPIVKKEKKIDHGISPLVQPNLQKASVSHAGEIEVYVAKLDFEAKSSHLVSSGIPFAPGQLMVVDGFVLKSKAGDEIPTSRKVLAYWPQDHSIRSVLVQFEYILVDKINSIDFEWGKKSSIVNDRIIEPRWDFSEAVIVMPAQWYVDSKVIGEQVVMGELYFKLYDNKLVKNQELTKAIPLTNNLSVDGFYSTAHVYYQMFVRSGELKYFIDAREELIKYRENELVHEDPHRGRAKFSTKSMYVYVQSMLDDYLLTGDPRTLEVAGWMAEYLKSYLKPERAFFPKDANHFWSERRMAFPFLGFISYYEMTLNSEYLELANRFMDNLYKTQLQWPNRGGFIHEMHAHDSDEGGRPGEYSGSPFMTGLLLEAVIKYHQITGSEKAKDSILRAVNWLIDEGLDEQGDAFLYLAVDYFKGTRGKPDLNMLILHSLGYAYRLSDYQEQRYLDVGQKVFYKGLKEGRANQRKHFNQQFRSSGHYLAYIYPGISNLAELYQNQRREIKKESNFLAEDFEGPCCGAFHKGAKTAIHRTSTQSASSHHSLHVAALEGESPLSINLWAPIWDITQYRYLEFDYLIPKGTPVSLRVQTNFGDWFCLASTVEAQCEGNNTENMIPLSVDEGWQTFKLDVHDVIKGILPAVKEIKGVNFSTFNNAEKNDKFWLDNFIIH